LHDAGSENQKRATRVIVTAERSSAFDERRETAPQQKNGPQQRDVSLVRQADMLPWGQKIRLSLAAPING
jgi:hypothetical protein